MMHRMILLAGSAVALAVSLAGCQDDEAAPAVAGLEGTWQLTDRQCYCARTPLPAETITFTATNFAKHVNGTLTDQGTYTIGTPAVCGVAASAPGLLFQSTSLTPYFGGATYTLTGDTLTLNYGSPCDAPLDTYVRKSPQKKP